jgi:hypothetical protein
MKPLLIATLLFSNVAYGQLNPDNNKSGNNVSEQHMQQQQMMQKQQYERKMQPQQVQELQREEQDFKLELQRSNLSDGINQ